MRIAPFLLVCFLILSATGWLNRSLLRLRIDRGKAIALILLVLALSAVPLEIGDHVFVLPACLLLLLLAVLRARSKEDFLLAFSAAFIAGVADWLLYRMIPDCFEWGLLLAIPQTLLCTLLLRREQTSLLCLMIAPIWFSLTLSLEEFFMFGDAKLMLGSNLLLDMQVCALALLFTLHSGTYVARRFLKHIRKPSSFAEKNHA